MKEHLRATTVTKNQFQQALTRIWAAQRSHAIQKIELEILFMQPGDKIKPVEIFSGTPLEAALVKSLLENAEIKAFLKDDLMGTLSPWHTSPGGTNPLKVFVSSNDVDKALQVVMEYEKNRKQEK